MHYLSAEIKFPDVTSSNKDGLLAIGGDLSVERLILAYQNGIFPWYEEGGPILWWSPDPRFVLFPENLKVSKSMTKELSTRNYEVTVNNDFKQVINECAIIKRDGQSGTWITKKMIDAYIKLHELGYAKSVEVWDNNQLIAGFYGIDIGNNVFSGESMFAKESNASKVGFISFVQNTAYKLFDCQVYTNHFKSLGAEDLPRKEFLSFLT